MKSTVSLSVLGLATRVLAFPAIQNDIADRLAEQLKGRQLDPLFPGPFTAPNLIPPTFDAKSQLIDVTGKHAYQAPRPTDVRGVCPGLNALANHGYLPRNGVGSIAQFIDATSTVYGMGVDLATFLGIYGSVIAGDTTAFSIGGPTNQSLPLGFLTEPRGLNYAHNKYELDASPTRGDLYLYGEAGDAQVAQWDQLYALQSHKSNDEADYNLEVLTPFRHARNLDSRHRNPWFFNAPFAGIALQPATYTFIWRFMANHTAEHPQGRLDQETLKSFFAFEGEPGNWQYKKGQERIPDNWYRRALNDPYGIPFYIQDVILAGKTYPILIEVGGNTGKPDTFTGVDPSDLTGGVFNGATLLQGNNLFCFAMEFATFEAADFLLNTVVNVADAVGKVNAAVGNAIKGLGCPKLSKVYTGPLDAYPGRTNLRKDGTYP